MVTAAFVFALRYLFFYQMDDVDYVGILLQNFHLSFYWSLYLKPYTAFVDCLQRLKFLATEELSFKCVQFFLSLLALTLANRYFVLYCDC